MRFALILLGFLTISIASSGMGRAQVTPSGGSALIWFGPRDPYFKPEMVGEGGSDFAQLFVGDSRWSKTARSLQYFKFYTDYFQRSSASELEVVFRWLADHRIQVALEAPMLTRTALCGNIEGYGAAQTVSALEKVRSLGRKVDVLVAGESLWFGHYYNGFSACRTDLPELLRNQVETARRAEAIFPNIRIMDTEPVSNFRDSDWPLVLRQWLMGFQDAFGKPYSGVQLDIAWWRPDWQSKTGVATDLLRQLAIPIGVIYNGNSPERSDELWTQEAAEHWREYERIFGLPHDAIFQAWTPHPAHSLPENARDTLTAVILDYVHQHSR